MGETVAAQNTPLEFQEEIYTHRVFGFWIYLMTDCLLFSAFFITYSVLHGSTFGGPSSKDLFSLPYALAETLLLLASSAACGLAMLSACKGRTIKVFFWLGAAFFLGLAFIALEWNEFAHLVREGNSWRRSAFLTGFFSLVGTHGLHVSAGLFWMLVMALQLAFFGLTVNTFRRLIYLNMFWHFLDLIWIFIFTFVYLMGVM